MSGPERPAGWKRRVVLKAGSTAFMSAWLAPMAGCGSSPPAAGSGPGWDLRGPDMPTPRARFLSDSERRTLQGLVDRLVPGHLTPGAAAAEADEAIDSLLGAFMTDPPLIYAGGPFSDRGGASVNDFERFIPLDEYEDLAWRLVVEGSQGLPEREFNGPVKGLQQIYREGLARLEERASLLVTGVLPAGLGDILNQIVGDTPLQEVLALVNTLTGTESFADLPALLRDIIVLDPSDAVVQELVDVAFPNTLDGTYGPPEYGGNKDRIGWTSMNFDGDVQPRGYTDAQVIHADTPGLFDSLLPPSFGGDPEARHASPASARSASAAESPLPFSLDELPPLVVSSDSLVAMIMDAQGSLSRLRAHIEPRVEARHAIWTWEAGNA